jgi:hypothetical protein
VFGVILATLTAPGPHATHAGGARSPATASSALTHGGLFSRGTPDPRPATGPTKPGP